MSGQYPGGYSPHGGHRGQFNAQQQQQMMNQMGPGPMDVGAQGTGSGGGPMMPMGGYSGGAGAGGLMPQQQQQAMGMGMQSPSHMQQQQQQMMPMQQQMQMQHQQQMAGGGGMQHMGNMMNAAGQAAMLPNQGMHMQQQQQQQAQHMNPNMQQPQMQQQVGNNPGHTMPQPPHHQQAAPNVQLQQPASSSMLTMSHPTPPKEINIVQLSRLGQETVQDITSRFQEVFSALKIIQPTQNRDNNTEKKVQENFRTIRLLFKRVRIIYEKCNDGYPQGLEYAHVESLIPMKDEPDLRIDGIHCEEYRKVFQENQELIETVKLKNRQLREIIDRTRLIIWEINTMLAMRRS